MNYIDICIIYIGCAPLGNSSWLRACIQNFTLLRYFTMLLQERYLGEQHSRPLHEYTLKRRNTQKDTKRHRNTRKDTEGHEKTQKDTKRHRKTRKDTERRFYTLNTHKQSDLTVSNSLFAVHRRTFCDVRKFACGLRTINLHAKSECK